MCAKRDDLAAGTIGTFYAAKYSYVHFCQCVFFSLNHLQLDTFHNGVIHENCTKPPQGSAFFHFFIHFLEFFPVDIKLKHSVFRDFTTCSSHHDKSILVLDGWLILKTKRQWWFCDPELLKKVNVYAYYKDFISTHEHLGQCQNTMYQLKNTSFLFRSIFMYIKKKRNRLTFQKIYIEPKLAIVLLCVHNSECLYL